MPRPTATPTATEPSLHVTMRAPLVLPGGTQHVAVAYVPQAAIQVGVTFPGHRAVTLYSATDGHGRLTLAVAVPRRLPLHGGHATGRVAVRAVAGPWRRLTTLKLSLRPATAQQITVPRVRETIIRAVVTFAGRAPIMLFGRTDKAGHFTLSVPAQTRPSLHGDRARASVALWTVIEKHHATATRALHVSDLVVSLTVGPFVRCTQAQTVRVAYHPDTPLRLVITFPRHRPVSISVRTDHAGAVSVRIHVAYVHAVSPVAIAVRAAVVTAGARRAESTGLRVALPKACRSR